MFSWLFGGSKSATKVVDTGADLLTTAASGVDMLFFTDEERSQASQKAFNSWVEAQAAFRDESSIRSLTRRILAVMFCVFYLLLIFGSVVLYRVDEAWGKLCFEMAEILTPIVGAVIFFYFGPNQIARAVKTAKGK